MGAAEDALTYWSAATSLLLELCEQPDATIGGAALADHFPQAGRRLIDAGLLAPVDNPSTVTCRACETWHPAEVEFDRRTGFHRHFCAEAGWVEVSPADLCSYRVDLTRLTEELARTLNLRRPVCLIEDVLWELGEGRLGEQAWTALFGRRLTVQRYLDAAVRVLAQRVGKSPGLLLTTSKISLHVVLPGGHRVLPLKVCLSLDADGLMIDWGVIVAASKATLDGNAARSGMPGRPSVKDHYLAEHQRRIAAGEVLEQIGAEARYLHGWMKNTHPLLPAGGVRSIENTIRAQHNAWRRQHQ